MSITENNFWNTLQSWFRKFVKIETFLTVLSSVRSFVMIERFTSFTVNTCVLWCLVLQRFLIQTVVYGFSKKSQKQFGSVNLGSCKRAPRTAGRSLMCSKTGSQYHPIHENGYQYLIGRILTTVSPQKCQKVISFVCVIFVEQFSFFTIREIDRQTVKMILITNYCQKCLVEEHQITFTFSRLA